MDAQLWQLIAYCAGTGGSILIIGSAAGVAFMGMEKADFFWYLKKVCSPKREMPGPDPQTLSPQTPTPRSLC